MLKRFPDVPLTFISIKPSITRWNLEKTVRYANRLIREEIEKSNANHYYLDVFDHMLSPTGLPVKDLFDTDGLHLSRKGYLLWKEVLLQHFATIFKIS